MKSFTQFTMRERVLVIAGGALIIIAMVWTYAWQPMLSQRAIQADRIARYLAIVRIVNDAPDATQKGQQISETNAPLAPRITQSAEIANIPLARLDPDGARLRITIANVDFATVMAWIANLEAQNGVRMVSVDLSRLTELGQVSARLTLEDAG